ncbi:MAG: class I SAM-dependent methyltransferase, partial [Acidobacteriota bacterium]|nr:class I SAM-dependent methyltransferase [Acidobacteriota bacterium]
MKKFVGSSAIVKQILLLVLSLSLISGCRRANLSPIETAQTAAGITPNTTATPTPQTNDNINRPRSEPYTGDLSIFEDPKREENLQIGRVMDILKISEGKSVADIGAGSGWFSVRAAKRVGNNGKVFAVEINQDYINYINDRARRENFANIQTILGTEDNPKLPAASVDAVLILKTYHEIGQPVKVLKNLRASLKKDALVGIIDRNGAGDDHGIKKEVVIDELK